MKVTDIMITDPVLVEAPGNRSTVLKLLVQNNLTGVPVVKEGTTKYVGFVTRQDLFTKADVILHHLAETTGEDGVDGSVFNVHVARSMTEYLWFWLVDAAAEYRMQPME